MLSILLDNSRPIGGVKTINDFFDKVFILD